MALLIADSGEGLAQPDGFNYDEANVPQYELPDPLVTADGKPVETAQQWNEVRRPELLNLFAEHVYGRSPAQPSVVAEVFEEGTALGGAAIRKQVAISLSGTADGPRMEMLLYLPADAAKAVPCFLGLNFQGNQTVQPDPAIRITDSWVRSRNDGSVENHRATEQSRGVAASRWPVGEIVERGYAVATIYYGDIDPDFDDGFENGVHGLHDDFDTEQRPPDAWGSIAGWAWGLSLALDYLVENPNVDGERVAVLGHSRLGKTALWAGAVDERFAMVISNNSGCGGAALSRRRFGETVERINTSFPHWFNDNFTRYNGSEDALPVDQHQLIALIAPRPVYVASATEDRWADPRGEFLACLHADPVYRLLTGEGLPADQMPAPDEPVQGRIAYHLRSGSHDLTAYDWQRYMDVADRHLK